MLGLDSSLPGNVMNRANTFRWTNKSVLALAGSEDPISVIERKARSLADNCELLFRAYNVFVKAKTTGRPRLLLEAVKAEQARRRAA